MNNDVKNLPVKFNEQKILESPKLMKILNGLAETVSVSGTSRVKEDEIKCLIKEVKQKHTEYLQNEVLTKAIKDTVRSSKYSEVIPSKKMQEMIVAEELSNYINLKPENKEQADPVKYSLFGLRLDVSDNKFSHQEYSCLKFAVEETLAESALEISKNYPADLSQLNISTESYDRKLELLQMKLELDNKLKEYNETLANFIPLLEEPFQECVTNLKEAILKKLKYLSTKIDLFLLKAEVNRHQIMVEFYKEEENAVEAFNKINELLENEAKSTGSALIKLKAKIKTYEKLKGTHFDQVLNKYLMVRKSINEKIWTLKELNK